MQDTPKILYISKAFAGNIGATMHYTAIKEIYGEENVYTVSLSSEDKPCKKGNYIAFGKYKIKPGRIIRWCQGNMMFISNGIIRKICKLIRDKQIKTVFIDDSVFGNLVKRIKRKMPDVRVITFYLDVKALLYPQWIKAAKTRVGKIEYSIGIKQEKINQQYSDCNLVFNKREADAFERAYQKRPEGIIALPGLVPTSVGEAEARVDNTLKLLFVGRKYGPNMTGLAWFVDHVLPSLPDHIEVQVVGRGLECLRGVYTDPRMHIIGGVESLDTYYKNADVVIAPLFEGGGMKTKTVEAMSYGKCFLGTEEALVGFWEAMDETYRDKMVFSHDDPEGWIRCINAFSEQPPLKFYKELYEFFKKNYSYEASLEKLKLYLFN